MASIEPSVIDHRTFRNSPSLRSVSYGAALRSCKIFARRRAAMGRPLLMAPILAWCTGPTRLLLNANGMSPHGRVRWAAVRPPDSVRMGVRMMCAESADAQPRLRGRLRSPWG